MRVHCPSFYAKCSFGSSEENERKEKNFGKGRKNGEGKWKKRGKRKKMILSNDLVTTLPGYEQRNETPSEAKWFA